MGLLPSGPDPVGEEHVRANLPIRYMRGKTRDDKGCRVKIGLCCMLLVALVLETNYDGK